jgi:hypothetical protein
MTKGDRENLQRIAKMNARVARQQVEQIKAERIAQAEAALSRTFKKYEEAWAEAVEQAEEDIHKVRVRVGKHIQSVLQEEGVPDDFMPQLQIVSWWRERGENEMAGRRAELRMRARTRVQADGEAAVAAIDAGEVKVLTQLLAGGLETDQAQKFLEAMPNAAELMPEIDNDRLAAIANTKLTKSQQRQLEWEHYRKRTVLSVVEDDDDDI